MRKLTVDQAMYGIASFVFFILMFIALLSYEAVLHNISATSNLTMTLLSVFALLLVIDVVFVILTVRAFLYPDDVEEPKASFEDLFVEERTPFYAKPVNDDALHGNAHARIK
jgi:hypothetical protein